MPFAGAGSPPGKQDLIKEVRCVLSLARRNLAPVCRRSSLYEVRMVLLLLAAVAPVPRPAKVLVAARQRLLKAQHSSKSSFEMIKNALEYTGNQHPCQVFFW